MTHYILANLTASITELKKHPMATVKSAEGEPIAILNRNEPIFYCVPARTYEAIMDMLEDIHITEIVRKRKDEEEITVNLDDL